jgi:hypothetical protein
MANRALLYSSDNGNPDDPDNWEYPHDNPLYDSRWTFPFAWFFLFQIPDMKITGIEEIKFLAGKHRALTTFERRLPLLCNVIGNQYDSHRIISGFMEDIRRWPGKYLLVDPRQIFQDFPEEDMAYCQNVLKRIDLRDVPVGEVIEAAKRYCCFDYPNEEEFVKHVIGFCYHS